MKIDKSQIKYPDLLSKPNLTVWISTFINDEMIRHQQAKSLVGNFLQFLYIKFAYQDSTNWVAGSSPFESMTKIYDISNTSRSMAAVANNQLDAGIGIDLYGLLVGTGTTTPSPTDIVMQTKIAHGNTSGKLLYSAMSGIQGVEVSGANSSFIIRRTFTNSSGATINVSELALYIKMSSYYFLILRDIFSPADEVLNKKLYRIDLTFTIET